MRNALIKELPFPGSRTILVSQKADDQYQTINSALRDAKEGDHILISPGVYQENILITKNIELIGDGEKNDIILKSIDHTPISIKTDKAILKNLTIKNHTSIVGLLKKKKSYGIEISSGQSIIENCNISSNSFACIISAIHSAE